MVILPKSDAKKTKYSLAASTGCTGYAHWLHWRHAPINPENISVMDVKMFLNVTKHNLSFFWGLSPSRIGYWHFFIESAHWLHWSHSLVALVAFTGRTGCIHWLHWLHPEHKNLENIGGLAIKNFWKVTKHNIRFFWGLSPSRIGY